MALTPKNGVAGAPPRLHRREMSESCRPSADADPNALDAPEGVFLAVHAFWRTGAVDEAAVAAAAARAGLSVAAFEEIRDFHAEVLSPGPEPLRLCVGGSCRLDGAATFHVGIRAAFDAAGNPRPIETVNCLGRCDRGPNIACGARTLCGKHRVIETDERTWRRPTPNPAPPVRD